MKLWQKIFLCTLALVVLAVNITSWVLLASNHEAAVSAERRNALFSHEYLSSTLKNKIVFERLKGNIILFSESEVADIVYEVLEEQNNSYAGVYLFQEDSCIVRNNDLDTSQVRELLSTSSEDSSHLTQIKEINHEFFLFTSSVVTLEAYDYTFITSKNISYVYEQYEQQLQFVRLFSIAAAVLCAGVLLSIVKFLLLPLQKVQDATRQIADGNYEKRLTVKGSDEISELSQNMNRMADSIEENISALKEVAENRKNFIANLAHEMKTPLTSILGFADILRIKRNVDEEERREYAGIIVEETKRMRSLSGKLMELITVGNTQADFTYSDISVLLDEVHLSLTPILKMRNLSLIVTASSIILPVDKELFKSLIYNLIDNAIKASHENGKILLTATAEKEGAEIRIQDFGIGIPEQDLQKIMEPFYMVDKVRTRKGGGAGLGLALCAEIAALHQGTISVESELDKGTTVILKFKGGSSS